jgi:hypothetical protein
MSWSAPQMTALLSALHIFSARNGARLIAAYGETGGPYGRLRS